MDFDGILIYDNHLTWQKQIKLWIENWSQSSKDQDKEFDEGLRKTWFQFLLFSALT